MLLCASIFLNYEYVKICLTKRLPHVYRLIGSPHGFKVETMACISMLLRSSSFEHASDFTHSVYLGYIRDDRNREWSSLARLVT